MNPWIAKAVVLAATVVMLAIRAPHGRRSRNVKVAESHKTPLETVILVLAWVASFFVPLIWVRHRRSGSRSTRYAPSRLSLA